MKRGVSLKDVKDQQKYYVVFESVFINEEIKSAFYKHLIKEFNSDPFDFLMDIELLRQEDEDFIEMSKEIFNTYIKTDSKKEVNISMVEKKKIINFFEQLEFVEKLKKKKKPKENIEDEYEKIFQLKKKSTKTEEKPKNIIEFVSKRNSKSFEILNKISNMEDENQEQNEEKKSKLEQLREKIKTETQLNKREKEREKEKNPKNSPVVELSLKLSEMCGSYPKFNFSSSTNNEKKSSGSIGSLSNDLDEVSKEKRETKDKNKKNRKSKAKEIELKNQLLSNLFEIKEVYLKIYFEVVKIIINEIKYDNFPRFVNSKEFEILFEKYKNDKNVIGSYKQKNFPYSEVDFQTHMVTEKDIEFLLEIFKETMDMKLVYQIKEKKANGFVSVCNLETIMPNLEFSKNSGILKSTVNHLI
jgi:hypothetical protein